MDFENALTALKAEFEDYLAKNFPKGAPKELFDSMAYSLFSGGKRLRPLLLLGSFLAFSQDKEKAFPFAMALEMIHTYSLIHDDLPAMDNDALRRGKPTNHIIFGDGMATLSGDGLLNLAYEVILNNIKDKTTLKAGRMIARSAGVFGMVGGQGLDLLNEDKPLSEDELNEINKLKTGALISCAMYSGAVLAGSSENAANDFYKSGSLLGAAFQIKDDCLDKTGSAKVLGKEPGQDAKNKKLTYPDILGLENAQKKVESLTREAVGILLNYENTGFLIDLSIYMKKRDK